MPARIVYVVEDCTGTAITSSTSEQEAREFGEIVAEWNEENGQDCNYYLAAHTLH